MILTQRFLVWKLLVWKLAVWLASGRLSRSRAPTGEHERISLKVRAKLKKKVMSFWRKSFLGSHASVCFAGFFLARRASEPASAHFNNVTSVALVYIQCKLIICVWNGVRVVVSYLYKRYEVNMRMATVHLSLSAAAAAFVLNTLLFPWVPGCSRFRKGGCSGNRM